MASFERDKRVRRWCRQHGVQVIEHNQTGVTRGLHDRDHFDRKYAAWLAKPQCEPPDPAALKERLVTDLSSCGLLAPDALPEVAAEYRADRANRQSGGESHALGALRSFLDERGEGFSAGISSPTLAWSSCTRLSPYITAGQLSIKRTMHALSAKQVAVRRLQTGAAGAWPRSLSAAKARLKWRSYETLDFPARICLFLT